MPSNNNVTVAERYQKPKPILKSPAVNENFKCFAKFSSFAKIGRH